MSITAVGQEALMKDQVDMGETQHGKLFTLILITVKSMQALHLLIIRMVGLSTLGEIIPGIPPTGETLVSTLIRHRLIMVMAIVTTAMVASITTKPTTLPT